MTRLIALDTETTGLDERVEAIFEVACVDVHTGREWVWTIQPPDAVVDAMHPKAAEVNRYHERTSAPDWEWTVANGDPHATMDSTLDGIAEVLDGAHVIGAVPDFDTTKFLTRLYRSRGREAPRWHYHLIDAEVLAVGYIMAVRRMLQTLRVDTGHLDDLIELPYRSDDLAAWCDVEPPADDDRHTALGDARWVARWYRELRGDFTLSHDDPEPARPTPLSDREVAADGS